MATEMITLKLEQHFLREIDSVVKQDNYQSRTEFIRDALRDKMDDIKLKAAALELAHLKGMVKRRRKVDYEEARMKAFKEI